MAKAKKVENSTVETVKQETSVSLSKLAPAPGSNHRKKIVGRGEGSGHGGSATRGMKGQRSRRGDTKMIGFEGGQMPLLRRIPKRGFNPPFRKNIQILNVCDLEFLFEANTEVSPQMLFEKGFVKKDIPLKILAGGELKKPLKVSAQYFSKQAEEKIKAAGGSVQVL